MSRKRRSFDFEDKMDMTPLIDVVFLLIMFFILTTEITARVEEVDLPFALEGRTEKSEDTEIVVVINVVLEQNPTRRGEARIVLDGSEVSEQELRERLETEVEYDMAEPPYGRGRAPEPGIAGAKLSQLKVRVRADKGANAEYLRTIFQACSDVDPKIYKIEISSEKPSEG